MDRFHKVMVLALVCLSISLGWEVFALPAPGRNSVVTPGGQTTPCTYDVYKDGSTYVAKDCKTGDNAAQSTTFSTVWNAIIASNIAIFFEPAIYDTVGGVSIIDLTGITLWGVYNQTTFRVSTAAGAALNIGNPNANDGLYHAKGIYVHDMTFDGGLAQGISNGAGLGVTTAFDVDIDHVIVEQAGEIATGGFRVTDWNAAQIPSKNIFIHHSLFLGCKITIASVINGFMEYSTFQGSAPGIIGSTALVDFSKCDFSPCGIQQVSNFDFDHNTVYGWTTRFMQGLQAVNNATITYNFVQDASNLINTVAVSTPVCNGVIVAFNTFAKSSGGVTFNYCTNIQIANNQWLTDSAPGGASIAIIADSQGTAAGPSDVIIQNNEISKWGGIGILANFTRGEITGNEIYDVNQANQNGNSQVGLMIRKGLIDVTITGNTIISDTSSGAGVSRPIDYIGVAKNITIVQNYLRMEFDTSPSGGIRFDASKDASVQIRYNVGYTTENQGSCNISASTTCTVTHKLAGTPTSVQVTAGTTGTGVYFVTSVGATTFVITTTTSGTFTMYWEAKFWN